MIAVIYARVSSNSGRQDTERQVNELSAYARNNNIEVAKVFQDYVSGATPNVQRWVLQNCLKYCTEENTKVSCILMSEVSRLGRDTWEMIELVKFFHDHHLNVYFMRENLFMSSRLTNIFAQSQSISAIYVLRLSLSVSFPNRQRECFLLQTGG